MKGLLVLVGMIIVLIIVIGVIKSFFNNSNFSITKFIISILFFGAIGYGLGTYVSDGWGYFGMFFGAFLGIEFKEKLFELVEELYDDFLER